MLARLIQGLTEQQFAHGEVDRKEFEPDAAAFPVPWADDPEARPKLERFVLSNTPERHRFKTAGGQDGIVYFDDRGRAASAVFSQIDDQTLLKVARGLGKRWPGDPNGKPQTSRKEHGYERPGVAEEVDRSKRELQGTETELLRAKAAVRAARDAFDVFVRNKSSSEPEIREVEADLREAASALSRADASVRKIRLGR